MRKMAAMKRVQKIRGEEMKKIVKREDREKYEIRIKRERLIKYRLHQIICVCMRVFARERER